MQSKICRYLHRCYVEFSSTKLGFKIVLIFEKRTKANIIILTNMHDCFFMLCDFFSKLTTICYKYNFMNYKNNRYIQAFRYIFEL